MIESLGAWVLSHRFVPNWPALESLVLDINSCGFAMDSGMLASHFKLAHIHTKELALLANLPTSIKSVAVHDYMAVDIRQTSPPHTFHTDLNKALASKAPQLEQLSLRGMLDTFPVGPTLRGYHDQLVSNLNAVRKLVIPAFAVSNLAAALTRLKHLADLEIMSQELHHSSAKAIEADEVVQLVSDAPSLERLALRPETFWAWTDQGREAVMGVADQKGVKLVDAKRFPG